MSEERFNPMAQDQLDRLIIRQLGERQYILDRMQELDRANNATLGKRHLFFAIAACVLIAFLLFPNIMKTSSPLDTAGINPPELESYRNADEDVTEIILLMEGEEYDAVLSKLKTIINEYDAQEKSIRTDELDDEQLYEYQYGCLKNAELRWTYIYLLVHEKQYDEAKLQIQKYLKQKNFADHVEEAKRLLKEIK